jgi:hypothetical protein
MEYTKKVTLPIRGNGLSNEVGGNAIWDGPLSQESRPHMQGSSSGKNGMEILKYPTPYKDSPITQCAKKGRYNETY